MVDLIIVLVVIGIICIAVRASPLEPPWIKTLIYCVLAIPAVVLTIRFLATYLPGLN